MWINTCIWHIVCTTILYVNVSLPCCWMLMVYVSIEQHLVHSTANASGRAIEGNHLNVHSPAPAAGVWGPRRTTPSCTRIELRSMLNFSATKNAPWDLLVA